MQTHSENFLSDEDSSSNDLTIVSKKSPASQDEYTYHEINKWLFQQIKDHRFPPSQLTKRNKEKYQPKIKASDIQSIGLNKIESRVRIYSGSITDVYIEQGKKGVITTANNGDLLIGCGYALAKAAVNAAGPGLQQELYNRFGVPRLNVSQYARENYPHSEGRGYAITCQSYDMQTSHNIDRIELLIVPMETNAGVENMYYEALIHNKDLDYIVIPMAGMTHPVIDNDHDKNAYFATKAVIKFINNYPESNLNIIFAIYNNINAEQSYKNHILNHEAYEYEYAYSNTEECIRSCLSILNDFQCNDDLLRKKVSEGEYILNGPIIAFRADSRNPDTIFAEGFSAYAFQRMEMCPSCNCDSDTSVCDTCCYFAKFSFLNCAPIFFPFDLICCLTKGSMAYNGPYDSRWPTLALTTQFSSANQGFGTKSDYKYIYLVYMDSAVNFKQFSSDLLEGEELGRNLLNHYVEDENEIFPPNLDNQFIFSDKIISCIIQDTNRNTLKVKYNPFFFKYDLFSKDQNKEYIITDDFHLNETVKHINNHITTKLQKYHQHNLKIQKNKNITSDDNEKDLILLDEPAQLRTDTHTFFKKNIENKVELVDENTTLLEQGNSCVLF